MLPTLNQNKSFKFFCIIEVYGYIVFNSLCRVFNIFNRLSCPIPEFIQKIIVSGGLMNYIISGREF